MSQHELRAEIDHHARARAAMAAMRRTTVEVMGAFEAEFEESRQNLFADDAGPNHSMGHAMAGYGGSRLEDLADGDVPLFFGRLWLESGEDYHLGRRHVRDEADRSEPLVVDWRAPVAERFYRASAHHRLGVARRRRFGFAGTALTGFEDEDLRHGEDFSSDLLAAEIERPRTGPMRDIVATIQPEQDELIRRAADTTLCVQGAPGTGKTAVALHRAAWLLYTYPTRLRRGGMLVVGPNQGFLRYISGVLPTLGERAVRQATVGELAGTADTDRRDAPHVDLLKHDARMAEVCRWAVWRHRGHVEGDLAVPLGGVDWVLDADYVRRAVERAHATARTWSAGRTSLEQSLLHGFMRHYEARRRRAADAAWSARLRRQPAFKGFLDQVWPALTAKKAMRRLYRDPGFRREVCAGLLSEQEQGLLQGRTSALRPTSADLLLLDEIQGQLQPLPASRTYDHVVVDEAQDLSPMQCRAIARRCPSGAMTVLGDLAQGTTPWAATDWDTQMEHLGRPDAEHTELTTGFRVPAVIIDLANRLLPRLGVSVAPGRSVRRDGSVQTLACRDIAAGAADAVDKALVEEGLVGVVAPERHLEQVRRALPDHDRVELVPAGLAKGLEYDHVVVLEPWDFIHPTDLVGLRQLYVALTRGVSRLTVVHGKGLPPELGLTSGPGRPTTLTPR